MLGHRAEKCRKSGDGYDENVVKKFETNLRSAKNIMKILNTFMNIKRKEEIDYKQNREVQLAKGLPANTSLMIGQDFDVWKKELEK